MKHQHLSQTKNDIAFNNRESAIASPQSQTNTIARSSTHPIVELQGAIGNRAVNQLMEKQAKQGGQNERSHLNNIPSITKQPIQAKALFRGLSHELSSDLSSVQSGGKKLPEEVQQKMETAFGADFSDVRIHEGKEAESIGAIAYTHGRDIHFAPGKYDPISHIGQQLLGHELTHVVQQQAGQVTAPQGKGIPINAESRFENEAESLSVKVARGEPVQVAGAAVWEQPATASDEGIVMQCASKDDELDEELPTESDKSEEIKEDRTDESASDDESKENLEYKEEKNSIDEEFNSQSELKSFDLIKKDPRFKELIGKKASIFSKQKLKRLVKGDQSISHQVEEGTKKRFLNKKGIKKTGATLAEKTPGLGLVAKAKKAVDSNEVKKAMKSIAEHADESGNPLAAKLAKGLQEHYEQKRNEKVVQTGISTAMTAASPFMPTPIADIGGGMVATLATEAANKSIKKLGTEALNKGVNKATSKLGDATKSKKEETLSSMTIMTEKPGFFKRIKNQLKKNQEPKGFGNLESQEVQETDSGNKFSFEEKEKVKSSNSQVMRALLLYLAQKEINQEEFKQDDNPDLLRRLDLTEKITFDKLKQFEKVRVELKRKLGSNESDSIELAEDKEDKELLSDLKNRKNEKASGLKNFFRRKLMKQSKSHKYEGALSEDPTNYLRLMLSALGELKDEKEVKELKKKQREQEEKNLKMFDEKEETERLMGARKPSYTEFDDSSEKASRLPKDINYYLNKMRKMKKAGHSNQDLEKFLEAERLDSEAVNAIIKQYRD